MQKCFTKGDISRMGTKECKFFKICYFADPIRDEAINIGIILLSAGDCDEHLPLVRLTKNWRRVLCIDRNADIQMLAKLEESLQSRILESGATNDAALENLYDCLSTSIRLERKATPLIVQFREERPVLTDNFEDELDRLMKLYVYERPQDGDDQCSEDPIMERL
jgi:DUF3037 family protein